MLGISLKQKMIWILAFPAMLLPAFSGTAGGSDDEALFP